MKTRDQGEEGKQDTRRGKKNKGHQQRQAVVKCMPSTARSPSSVTQRPFILPTTLIKGWLYWNRDSRATIIIHDSEQIIFESFCLSNQVLITFTRTPTQHTHMQAHQLFFRCPALRGLCSAEKHKWCLSTRRNHNTLVSRNT